MSRTKAYCNHIKNYEIETREVFERETSSPENIQWTLLTDIVTRLDDNQLTRSADSSKHEKTNEPEVNTDPEPSSSDSSDPSSSDDSDSSDDNHYRRTQRNNKIHQKKGPIRLCATLTEKLLTTAYKSKIIRFKMDKYPLQRLIYFLTF